LTEECSVMTVQEPPAAGKPTHYQVLMLDRDVDDDVLTEVYRRLIQRAQLADLDEARRARRLRAIERAYVVLHDPIRRTLYDLELEDGANDDAEARRDGQDRVAVPMADARGGSVSATGTRAAVSSGAPPARAVLPVAAPPTRAPVPVTRSSSTSTPGSRVLDFGRYAGWTLRQVALQDRDYLEWLRRTPLGRQYQAEIAAVLAPR